MKRFSVCWWLWFSLLVLPACRDKQPDSGQNENSATKTGAKVEFNRVIGRWVRPDGGYVIEIRNVTSGGIMDVSYYNPNPINIAEGVAQIHDGRLHIFIKFDDKNYRGSTYDLTYNPKEDILTGTYFQALMNQTFDVFFQKME